MSASDPTKATTPSGGAATKPVDATAEALAADAAQATAHAATSAADKGATNPKAPATTPPTSSNGGAGYQRTLTVWDMVIYGMIFMVPIAPFAIYGSIFQTSNGMPALAYVIAGVAMIFTVFSFGVMIDLFPSSGSIFTYASKTMNPAIGFVTGWLMLLQYAITPAIMYIMAGTALQQYLPQVPVWVWCLVFLAFTTAVCTHSTKAMMRIDRIALVCELVVLAIFLVCGIVYCFSHPSSGFSLTAVFNPSKFNMSDMMSAVSLAALSYVGFGSVATLTQQAKNGKTGPSKAMLIIVVALICMFFGMCYIATCVDPTGSLFDQNATNINNGFYIVAQEVGGTWLGVLCVLANALALGLFTGIAGVTSVSHIMYAMGKAGQLPERFGTMGKGKRATQPMFAILFECGLTLVLIFALIPVGMDTAAKFSNYGALSTYCVLNLCVLWYCWFKQKEHKKVGRYLVMPLLGAVFTGVIFCSLGQLPLIVGTVWAIIGMFYFMFQTEVQKKKVQISDVDGTETTWRFGKVLEDVRKSVKKVEKA